MDIETGRRTLGELADEHPESAALAHVTGLAWGTEEPVDHEAAAKWFRKAVYAAPSDRDFADNYAAALLKFTDIETVRRIFGELADEHPESATLAHVTGLAWGTEEPVDHEAAAKWFRKAVYAAPSDRDLAGNYAAALLKSTDIETGRRTLGELADEHPKSAALALVTGLAWGTEEPKDIKKANDLLDRTIKLANDDPSLIDAADKIRSQLE